VRVWPSGTVQIRAVEHLTSKPAVAVFSQRAVAVEAFESMYPQASDAGSRWMVMPVVAISSHTFFDSHGFGRRTVPDRLPSLALEVAEP
jgi:hypothetical protein